MFRRANGFLIGCATVLALAATPAANANLVTNGGFETGSLAGWTQFGDTSFTGVDGASPQSGSFGAYFGPSSPGGISQVLFTAVGGHYVVGFWLHDEADLSGTFLPNSFAFSWGGVTEMSLSNATLPNYTHYTFDLIATSALTTISFTFTNQPAFWDLDNVTVVPEPDTLALMALAGGMALLRARRRQVR